MSAEDFHRLHQELAKERELRWGYERQRNHLLQLAYDIFDTLPAMEQGGPCPVCWTYTHKSWCYYERLKKAVEEME
jgi:hypothetical protein